MLRIAFPLDLGEEVSVALAEERVVKHLIRPALLAGFVEVVHVQLSDEGREVAVLEILW